MSLIEVAWLLECCWWWYTLCNCLMIHLGISVMFVQSDTVAGVFLLVLVLRLPGLCRDSWAGVVSLVGSLLISLFFWLLSSMSLWTMYFRYHDNGNGVNPRFEKKIPRYHCPLMSLWVATRGTRQERFSKAKYQTHRNQSEELKKIDTCCSTWMLKQMQDLRTKLRPKIWKIILSDWNYELYALQKKSLIHTQKAQSSIVIGKSLIDPPNYWGWSSLSPQLWNDLIYPLNFAKPAKSPPRAVLDGGLLQ
jgi:hypothetical protein